ncbi:MAG: hypothetical protein AseanaTS_02910 [Candidatus Pelagadaptatus aseana]|uniref:DUF4426 domain-containing protein n=1 Tax=Candidatus Pelagadaptatus aseana TaxID=3120508 RepID=UPI0039B2D1E5
MYLNLVRSFMGLLLLVATATSQASDNPSPFHQFDRHTVIVSVFTSSFLQPEIANTYGFSRGRDQALINVSVVPNPNTGNSVGLAADLKGTATNLMQQQSQLKFQQIKEGDAVYYLAPFRFINEEIVHLDLTVAIDGENYTLNITKKLYVDE